MSVRDHPDKKQNYGDNKMKKNISNTAKAAVIGAMYAVLTYLSAGMGLAFGGVQFRFSEALAVLPLFSPTACVGLAVGCAVSNIVSSVSPLDIIFGSTATLLAAVLTRLLRNVTVKRFPLPSFLSPVIVNGLVVGAEISLLGGTEEVSLALFAVNALSVAAGEAAVMFTLGVALWSLVRKNGTLRRTLER